MKYSVLEDKMKEIDFDLENNPFINFLSSRYTMIHKLLVLKIHNVCKGQC